MNAPILVGYRPQTLDRGPVEFGVAASRATRAPLGGAGVPAVARCEAAGRLEFQFCAAPLRLVGGTGSPLNPMAIL